MNITYILNTFKYSIYDEPVGMFGGGFFSSALLSRTVIFGFLVGEKYFGPGKILYIIDNIHLISLFYKY